MPYKENGDPSGCKIIKSLCLARMLGHAYFWFHINLWKVCMSFLRTTTSFTRFRIMDEIPKTLWTSIPDKLKQFAFRDIDESTEERSWGWTNFDDMLDTQWRVSPPEKGAYITFALRLDTRRIPPAVLKKHTRIALNVEEGRLREQGKKYVSRERKIELREQVKLRLMARFLPIPAEFAVVWAPESNTVYIGATQEKVLDMFMEHFELSFELKMEALTPFALALELLGEEAAAQLDLVEPSRFS